MLLRKKTDEHYGSHESAHHIAAMLSSSIPLDYLGRTGYKAIGENFTTSSVRPSKAFRK